MNIDRIFALIVSQYNELRRDFGAVFLIFLFPLSFALVLSGTALRGAPHRLEFGVADLSGTEAASQFVDALTSQNIRIRNYPQREAALTDIAGKIIPAAIVIPEGWSQDSSVPLQVVANAQMVGLVETVVDAARARVAMGHGADAQKMAYAIERVAGGASSFSFIYPGLLALALVHMGMFLTATPILRSRDRGTLRYILLTPTTTSELMISQIAFRIGVSLLQIVLLLFIGSFVVKLALTNWAMVMAVSALGMIMLVSIGYALAGAAPNAESGMALIMIVNFVLIFGGNIFWNPVDSAVLMTLASALPTSYLADAYRQVITGLPGLWPLWRDFAVMIVFTALALSVTRLTFSYDMDRTTPLGRRKRA
jgi:ABC-2 type transport system permease protein